MPALATGTDVEIFEADSLMALEISRVQTEPGRGRLEQPDGRDLRILAFKDYLGKQLKNKINQSMFHLVLTQKKDIGVHMYASHIHPPYALSCIAQTRSPEIYTPA